MVWPLGDVALGGEIGRDGERLLVWDIEDVGLRDETADDGKLLLVWDLEEVCLGGETDDGYVSFGVVMRKSTLRFLGRDGAARGSGMGVVLQAFVFADGRS